MPRSPRSSNASVSCRLEWRPSRWLIAAILALSALAAFSVVASEMPRTLAWPLAAAVLAHAVWLARREARKPVQAWFWPGTDQPVTVDGAVARDAVVAWRGPLAFVHWRDADGRRLHLCWWPDTLPAARRRELRLAASSAPASRSAASMAP
jgi:toxin CptA